MNEIDEKRWRGLSLAEQMANIGSEVGRSAKWLIKGNAVLADGAYLRALNLFDVTIACGRYGSDGRGEFLKELCRARDCFTEAYLLNDYDSLSYLDRYFGDFAKLCRADR